MAYTTRSSKKISCHTCLTNLLAGSTQLAKQIKGNFLSNTNQNGSIRRVTWCMSSRYKKQNNHREDFVGNKNKEFQQLCEQLLNDGDRKLKSPHSINARKELTELQKSCHPAFDNIDFSLSRRNMSMSEQNRDVHWVNHSLVRNRVSGNHLLTAREKDLLDIPSIQFFPSVEDQRWQRMNYIIFVSRILVDYFDSFNLFKDVCVCHIPHK